MKHRVDNPHSN